MIQPKAPEQAYDWTLIGDFFFLLTAVSIGHFFTGAYIMESFNIYISMATEQAQSDGEEDGVMRSKATELVR